LLTFFFSFLLSSLLSFFLSSLLLSFLLFFLLSIPIHLSSDDTNDVASTSHPNPADQDPDTDSDPESKALLVTTLVSCLNNMAACHLSMKEYAKAKELCIRVLELQPENVKSLLRAAKASLALHEYEESAVCLKLVSELRWVWSMVEGLY
jgi:tetratricopeptide (TPR) repeat protein